MNLGNWIALDKNLSKHFPDREFSKIEAAFSLAIDYDNNKLATVSGYSTLWGWSRSKVRNFLEEMGVEIIYPEDTSKNQKQKGQIKVQIRDRSETDKRQVRMVDTKASQSQKDRSRTDQGQIKDRSKDTTNKPNNNTKTKNKKEYTEEFEKLLSDYKNTNGSKSQTFKNYQKTLLVFEWQHSDVFKACMNYQESHYEKNGNYDYMYQLSNLVGDKYRDILKDYLIRKKKEITSEINPVEIARGYK